MKKNWFLVALVLLVFASQNLTAQYADTDTTYKRWFVGSSAFVLVSLIPDQKNPPQFFQLNVGYRLTNKDIITLEPKTWKYAWPNGIHPFLDDKYGTDEEKFPGRVREFGLSVSYQRFLWNGLYAELNVMPTLQHFVNTAGTRIDNGFQIFNTYRVGYHVKLFNDRFFIQPSMAVTHRAYHTTLPNGFKQLDDKWSKFVVPEPGFHFGFNF